EPAGPQSPQRSNDRTGRWHIPALPRSPRDCRPNLAAPQGSATGRTSHSPSKPPQTPPSVRKAQAQAPRCSATQASPGTADDATASAQGGAPQPDARTEAPGGCKPQGCPHAPGQQARGSSANPTCPCAE